jgi:UDP-N-acetylglucosamine/UDP-N-acetylgalactosamine diphosphorylase
MKIYFLTKTKTTKKVVNKVEPEEKVGVICKVSDRFQVVEYSEIDKETRELRDPHTGQLLFNAGNICQHFFSLDFLEQVSTYVFRKKKLFFSFKKRLTIFQLNDRKHEHELKHHVAEKRIPYVNERGERVAEPSSLNGIKLEKFVFDVFPFSK